MAQTIPTKYYLTIIIYMIILLSSAFVKDIYSFGGYIEILLCSILFGVSSKKSKYKNLLICIFLLSPVLFFSHNGLIYFFCDIASALLVLLIVDISTEVRISQTHTKHIYRFYWFYLLLFFLLMSDPSRFDGSDNRYIGLLPSATVSSSVLMMMIIGLIEHYKYSKYQIYIFVICVIVVIFNIFICKTRSVLFIFPYLIYVFYQLFDNKKLRILSWLLTFGILCGTIFVFTRNAEALRLSAEETSTLTRLNLYAAEWNMIKQAHYIIPAGFQACILRIQKITNENFSPHNSFFSYWIDWGVSWIFYLIILFRRLRLFAKRNNCEMKILLILLFISSCALHNILLYSFIWMPMILILNKCRNPRQLV